MENLREFENFIKKIDDKILEHHFYIITEINSEKKQILIKSIQKSFIKNPNNLENFLQKNFDKILIDDARDIISNAQIKTSLEEKRIFVISFDSITREAQNAFLKILEEPKTNTYFFFLTPSASAKIFLPTILSRAAVITADNTATSAIAKKLSKMTVGERVDFVDKIAEKIKKGTATKQQAEEVIKSIAVFFQEKIRDIETDPEKVLDSKNVLETKQILQKTKSILKISDYVSDNSSSVKILLERAVLLL